MNALKQVYYFVITALAIPITYIGGLYFTSVAQGTPIVEDEFFDNIKFIQDNAGLSITISYVFYGITAILIGMCIFFTFTIYYGRNSSDQDIGIKIFDRKKFRS